MDGSKNRWADGPQRGHSVWWLLGVLWSSWSTSKTSQLGTPGAFWSCGWGWTGLERSTNYPGRVGYQEENNDHQVGPDGYGVPHPWQLGVSWGGRSEATGDLRCTVDWVHRLWGSGFGTVGLSTSLWSRFGVVRAWKWRGLGCFFSKNGGVKYRISGQWWDGPTKGNRGWVRSENMVDLWNHFYPMVWRWGSRRRIRGWRTTKRWATRSFDRCKKYAKVEDVEKGDYTKRRRRRRPMDRGDGEEPRRSSRGSWKGLHRQRRLWRIRARRGSVRDEFNQQDVGGWWQEGIYGLHYEGHGGTERWEWGESRGTSIKGRREGQGSIFFWSICGQGRLKFCSGVV